MSTDKIPPESYQKALDNFNKSYTIDQNGCHVWKRKIPLRFSIQHDKKTIIIQAKRFAYSQHFNPPLTHFEYVLPTCDNNLCVNPLHLAISYDPLTPKQRSQQQRSLGEDSPLSKLTNENVIAIHQDPSKYKDIAKQYNVSHCTVWSIKRGKSWKHLNLAPLTRRNQSP